MCQKKVRSNRVSVQLLLESREAALQQALVVPQRAMRETDEIKKRMGTEDLNE